MPVFPLLFQVVLNFNSVSIFLLVVDKILWPITIFYFLSESYIFKGAIDYVAFNECLVEDLFSQGA